MPLTAEDFVGILAIIAGDEKYYISGSNSRWKGGLFTGAAATVGGVCGGPAGAVLGGLIGGTMAAWKGKEIKIPLDKYLIDMGRDERQELFVYMKYLVEECKVNNAVGLNAKLATDTSMRKRFFDVLLCYLKTEKGLKVVAV